MQLLKRNTQTFYYLLFIGKEEVIDGEGYSIGGQRVTYGEAVSMRANVSPATGTATIEQFGTSEQYDKIIFTTDMSCPIDENTVLFLDKEPEYDGDKPLFDYRVKQVSKTLNHIAIAVSKVSVS